MNKTIVAICENQQSVDALQNVVKGLNIEIKCEIQDTYEIKNKISKDEIRKADIVLFVISYSVEDIEEIERFIDIEYYEVEPQYVIKDAKAVINEIIQMH